MQVFVQTKDICLAARARQKSCGGCGTSIVWLWARQDNHRTSATVCRDRDVTQGDTGRNNLLKRKTGAREVR